MKKVLYTVSLIIVTFFLLSVSAFASSTSGALNDAKIQAALESGCPTKLNPPYNKDDYSSEYIDPITGSLSLTENILYLPGKNGLDVNLTCSYNNQSIRHSYIKDSTSYETSYDRIAFYYDYVKENGVTKSILVLFENEDVMLEEAPVLFIAEELPTVKEDDNTDEYYLYSSFDLSTEGIVFTRNLELASFPLAFSNSSKLSIPDMNTKAPLFGQMWTWNVPTVFSSIRPTYTKTKNDIKLYDLYTAFTDIDNEYRQLHFYYDIEDGDIEGVSLDVQSKDMYDTWYEDPKNDYVDAQRGITYRCKITDPQGRTMYFAQTGNIVAVEDRFGNMIKYTFESGKLTKIVDTLGRIISIEYIDNDVYLYVDNDGEGRNERILYAEFLYGFSNDYTLDPIGDLVADNTYTSTIVRFEDADTPQTKTYTYNKLHPMYFLSTNTCYHEEEVSEVVSEITYHNGLTTTYDYERNKTTSNGVSKYDYQVIKRSDCDDGEYFNVYTYDYSVLLNASSDTKTIKTRVSDSTTQTFTGGTYVEKKIITADNAALTEEYNYTSSYGRRKLNSTTQTYKNDSTSGIARKVKTSYDSKFRPSNTVYDDYEQTISYFGNSNFTQTVTYNQNEDVYVKTAYTLSAEGDDFYQDRTVDSMTVSESTDGGETYTDKYTVNYTYNPDGTLLSETVDPDGINQVTTYDYTYGTDGSITTTATISNLKDAESNSVADITTSSKVDYLGRLVSATDANGNETFYEYDNLGRVIKITNPDDTTVTYEYDTVNRTTIVTDEDGIMQKALYDGFGNILAAYKNTGTNTSPIWVAIAEYEYDSICRPISTTEYTVFSDTTPTKWVETQYSYGAFDNVSEVAVYDETGTELSKQTYTYNYADRIGSSTSTIEAHDVTNGGTSRKFTSVTIETAAKDGIAPPTVKQYLDRQGRLVKQIRTDGDDEYITTYIYDAVGNVLEYKDESAYADYDVDYSQKYEYNYLNKVVKAYNAEGNYTENTYDVLGRQISSTDYMGNTATYTYDSIGRMITESAPVDDGVTSLSSYYYDPNGNVVKTVVSAAAGDVAYTYSYDNRNRLISSFNGSTYAVNEYDGNQIVKSASGLESDADISDLSHTDTTYNVSEFVYDKFGNRITEKTFNGATTYTYDLAGNTLTTTDPNNNTTYNTYDSRGNLIHSSVDGDGIAYTYNSFNLITQAARGSNATNYTYDNLGRNITETTGANTITRTYNTQGQVASMSLTNGNSVLQTAEYEYNVLGNMISASDGTDTVEYTYNENGFPVREEKSGLITEYEYTTGNLMKSTTHSRRWINDPTDEEGYNTTFDISSFSYTYYPDGNVKTVSDTRGNTTYDTIYGYDAANRLIIANTTNNGARVRTWGYNYNNRGDRNTQTVTDANGVCTATVYTYTNHRLTTESTVNSTTTYTYDANGNTLSKSNADETYVYTYTPRNEVASVTKNGETYSYTYNASSLRTSKTSNGVTTSFIWAGDNIIREETPDKTTDYFYGVNRVSRTVKGDAYTYDVREPSYDEEGNRVVTTIPVNGYLEYYAYDGRGNVAHTLCPDIDLYVSPFYGSTSPLPEVDFNGDGLIDLTDLTMMSSYYPIVRDYYYSPFGEIWKGEIECDTNPFRYAGEYRDEETGDIYLRARYYNPSIGRFISVDPIKDGTNWYVYCNNNPIAFVDPNGLYDIVIDALTSMYNSKSKMDDNDDANHENIYATAYEEYNTAKETISNSTVYIENWGQLKSILAPIVNNDIVSLEEISAAKEVAIKAYNEKKQSELINDIVYTTALTVAIAPVVKYAISKLPLPNKISPPNQLTYDSVQFGTKYGKHVYDYPNLTHSQYKQLADSIFKNPSSIIYDETCAEFYYIKGNDLLRITSNGDFVSLYPGANSDRVLQAIERGISWVLN